MNYLYKILLAVMIVMLSGCMNTFTSNVKEQERRSENLLKMTPCSDPRPLACPPGDGPVCGIFKDGGGLEYSSGCMACTRRVVIGYIPGGCPLNRKEIIY